MFRIGMASIPSLLSVDFVENVYADYQRDPAAVSAEWRHYFDALGDGSAPAAGRNGDGDVAALQERVDALVRGYRSRGHMIAHIDPLQQSKAQPPEVDPTFFGITDADMDRRFACPTMEKDKLLPLREIIQRLRNTYCRSIGVQFMHIDDLKMRLWLQERMERTQNRIALSRAEQLRILTRLTDAVIFEEFLRKKFVGAKTFSLAGSESLIPLLDLAIERAADLGVGEIVLGMAHRGRLNVLANIIGKSPRDIFREFADADPERHLGGGDVKYHLGYSNDWLTAAGRRVHLSLCFNPSHLEFVNPVAAGRIRAKQDRRSDTRRTKHMALLIHGDASFIAEGVVQETLNLSRLPGYTTGGTLHVIVNNQLGFTTDPNEGRSTMYATSVAKMLPAPIFHVNGEDPEAVAQCVQLALEFRQKFQIDAVIDMYGYRRFGHNESDEPTFTQPVLYRRIAERKSVREGYLEHLLADGQVTCEEADRIAARQQELLEQNLASARSEPSLPPNNAPPLWHGYIGGPEHTAPDCATAVDKQELAALLENLTKTPAAFHPHPKIKTLLDHRLAMARGEQPLDWSTAEALAFATIAAQGIRIRLSGQDSGRGTFSQRHAILHDYETGEKFIPLQHVADSQAAVDIFNSPLSEAGVLGFDYGFSLDCPDGLVLWEAQFGDFVNAAQVIIDQFIVSAEKKWGHLSGLVLLLPNGWEGMGPEHTSARLERFLRLAAEDSIQIVNPTTPAQYFHCLRRQAVRRWRKPLVIFTPKSLLRHPQAVSTLAELATGQFQRILPDPLACPADKIRRVLLCSGKIFYELAAERDKLQRDDIAILRVEQLYPLADEIVQAALAPYRDGTPVVWVQEEPGNMGAWYSLRVRFGERIFGRLPFSLIARPYAASPATGSHSAHKLEQTRIINQALEIPA